MSSSDQRLKMLQIKLDVNMKDHRTMVYAPYMTIPGQGATGVYFMPTIPLGRSGIAEALEAINKAKPSRDDIIRVFFSKAEMVAVIGKMAEIARSKGTPLLPRQFTSESDLIGGTVAKADASNRFVFKGKDGRVLRLSAVSAALQDADGVKVRSMKVRAVRAADYKYGSTILVSNQEFGSPNKDAVVFKFKNSVRPLTISQAAERGIVRKNIAVIAELLFGSGQKFYYKGNPRFDYDIFSYSIDKSPRTPGQVWDLGTDGNTFAVTVRLRISPLARVLDKQTAQKMNQVQGCELTRAAIVRQWHELNQRSVPPGLDSAGLVDPPDIPQSRQFRASTALPGRTGRDMNRAVGPLRPTARYAGGAKTRKRRASGRQSRRHQR